MARTTESNGRLEREIFDEILEIIDETDYFDLEQKKGRSDWENIDVAILKAIREIEYNNDNPFSPVTIPQIQQKLKLNKALKKTPSRRTVYNHLNGLGPPQIMKPKSGLIDKGLVVKLGRGQYSSKMAKIAKSMAQEFLIREFYKTVPRLEGGKFEEFLDRNLSMINKRIGDYEKKSRIPFLGWFYRRKLNDLYYKRRYAKANIRKWLQEEFDFIENSTKITLLSSKKLPYFNIYKLRETLARVLYNLLRTEERQTLEKGKVFDPESCSLNIIISFAPEKRKYEGIGKRRQNQHKELVEIAENAKLLFPSWLKWKKRIEIDDDILAFMFLNAPSSQYVLEKYQYNIEDFKRKVENFKKRKDVGKKLMVEFWKNYFRLRDLGLIPLAIEKVKKNQELPFC